VTDSDYGYWAAKLAGLDPDPPADRTQMPCGFWRMRSGQPLAVWMDDGRRVALRGWGVGETLPTSAMEAIAEAGGFGKAVAEEFYRDAIEKGHWPDSEGPARELMDSLRQHGEALDRAADQIAEKLALYPDYRLTKKLAGEIIKAVTAAGGAINTYTESTKESENVERRDAAA